MARDERDVVAEIIGRADWRQELADEEESAARRLLNAYNRMLPRLRDENRKLVEAMNQAAAKGERITPKMLQDLQEFAGWVVRVETEMNDFARILESEMGDLSKNAIGTGIDAAQQMAARSAAVDGVVMAGVWNRPSVASVRNAVNYMDSPAMKKSLDKFGENAATSAADVVIAAVAQGKNPRATAALLEDWLPMPYSWAENMTRTVQIYSARGATHEAYRQNESIITGWMWVSATDNRTCLSCWSKHGRVFPLSQSLNDHHRGRCTAVPIVRGTSWWRSYPTGPERFDSLDAAQQIEIMGASMHEAWRKGEAGWDDFSRTYQNDIYGEMTRAASLAEIRRGK